MMHSTDVTQQAANSEREKQPNLTLWGAEFYRIDWVTIAAEYQNEAFCDSVDSESVKKSRPFSDNEGQVSANAEEDRRWSIYVWVKFQESTSVGSVKE